MSLDTELTRRQSLLSRLEVLLRSRPGEWLTMQELAEAGGFGGWRTRLSELSRRKQRPMRIEWNALNGAASRHRYVPDASEPSPELWPILGAPYGSEPFQLT